MFAIHLERSHQQFPDLDTDELKDLANAGDQTSRDHRIASTSSTTEGNFNLTSWNVLVSHAKVGLRELPPPPHLWIFYSAVFISLGVRRFENATWEKRVEYFLDTKSSIFLLHKIHWFWDIFSCPKSKPFTFGRFNYLNNWNTVGIWNPT